MTTTQAIMLLIGGGMIVYGLWRWGSARLAAMNLARVPTAGNGPACRLQVCGDVTVCHTCALAFDTGERDLPKCQDFPPLALTDRDVAKLERAIRAEGYDILSDPETGDVVLKLNQRFVVRDTFAMATCASSLPIITRVVGAGGAGGKK